MKKRRIESFVAALLAVMLIGAGLPARGQRRTAAAGQGTANSSKSKPPTNRNAPTANRVPAPVAAESRLTGVYRLDPERSDDPRRAAERAVAFDDPFGSRGGLVEELAQRLSSPDQLAIRRRGRLIDIASTRAPRTTFEADGRERVEPAADGRNVRTRAVLYGDELTVSSSGSMENQYRVIFAPIEGGRRLRVTRYIYVEQIAQPVLVQSFYDKTSTVARFSIYGEQLPPRPPSRTDTARRNTPQRPPSTDGRRNNPPQIRRPPQRQPPAARTDIPPRREEVFTVANGLQFVAVLNQNLSTRQTREGDRFTLTVRSPAQYAGATVEGYVSKVDPAGRVSGRAEMTLSFERIRLRDGRAADFSGYIERIRASNGDDVRIDPESTGDVEGRDDRTNRTAQRAAIGAAVGAIIGAIAGGGKGAGIGAIIGAGAGAGSVYAQGRDHLELASGTELTIRARAPR